MADTPEYHLIVDVNEGSKYQKLYDGSDITDAMASWSQAISDGREYVTLEALRKQA